ncbi:nuclease-related domain-containing protein [Celeribacter sp. PS-C1]|uniref:nuclease-related domain-containing protein n=1 Tax=Celeribacter sp. PS-C1 TaxID=2820813 RepID=UPI001CA5331B|nr:nuclease-related domain-containing protein [Celeribacter sp. PS-C1]MBW6418041.1 hypothetical protein [Celeribacter sp. PS-C1]
MTKSVFPPGPEPPRLKESLVKEALKKLQWETLSQHLEMVPFDDIILSELLGHIRRSTDFLLKRSNTAREKKRNTFIAALRELLVEKLGPSASEKLNALIEVVNQVEAGYEEISRTQSNTVAAKLLPETQASAALARAAANYNDLMDSFASTMRKAKVLNLQSVRIEDPDGQSYSPDGVVTNIVDTTSMTMLLLGHRFRWFDDERFLILPELPEASDDDIYKAGLTEALAASWRQWERMEQRCRYFEGDLEISVPPDLPQWVPEKTERVISYDHLTDPEILDQVANDRLADRLIQTFQEMSLQTNMMSKASGIEGAADLPPGVFVSPQEAHAGVALSEILGYSIVDDDERPAGLRLIEWVRGYSTLQVLAQQRYDDLGTIGLYFTIPRAELLGILERVGMKNGAAATFIDRASLKVNSRDLFDHPLIRTSEDRLIVFGPGLLTADPARVTLSALGNESEQLSRKGRAFEKQMLAFFKDQNLVAKSLKFKKGEMEYEYDVIVEWDDYLFLFECKNRSLSGYHPVAAYYFALEVDSAVKQVKRLVSGLLDSPELILERTGIDISNKRIVPCVLNSLPYAQCGENDGVFVADASGVKRFFEERYFNVNRPHHLEGNNAAILHRTAIKDFWEAENPTPEGLVRYLTDPFQIELLIGHTTTRHHLFGLGERTVVSVLDMVRTEISPASIAMMFGADPDAVAREQELVTKSIRAAVSRQNAKAVRDADRAWRLRSRNEPE